MKHSIKRFADGSYAKVQEDGSWFLRLANGQHFRGRENDSPEALSVVTQLHTDFVMELWATGRFKGGGLYQVQVQ